MTTATLVSVDRAVPTTASPPNGTVAPPPLKAAAAFLLDHLPHLTTRPEHVQQFRQTILDLAVRGQLVAQDRNDELVEKMIARIDAERLQLVTDGRLRKQKDIAPISTDRTPHLIPSGWKWVRVGEAALSTDYGTGQRTTNQSSGVPVLKMGDICQGTVVLGGQMTVPATIEDLPDLYLQKYDILYNRTNSAELVGKTGIFLGPDDQYTFASYLIRIRCAKHGPSPLYLNVAMNAPYFRRTQIIPHLKQQCGQANVNGTVLKNMIVPIPPLAEQLRIVARVDELMTLCNQLEAHLTTAQECNRRLLESVIHESLATSR